MTALRLSGVILGVGQASGKNLNNFLKPGFNLPLHGLRGFASLMVFLGHGLFGFHEHLHHFDSKIPLWIGNLGTFGVEIFFIISGFFITRSVLKYDLRQFFLLRFWKIYPIFLLFTLVFFIGNMLLHLEPEKSAWILLPLNLLHLNLFFDLPALTPNSWTISYEFWFYILAFLSMKPLFHNKVPLFSLLPALLFTIFFPMTLLFLGGVLLYFVQNNRAKEDVSDHRLRSGESTAEMLSLLLLIWLASREDYSYSWSLLIGDWHVGLLWTDALFFFWLIVRGRGLLSRALASKFLLYLGTISYSLYLSHPYSYLLVRKLFAFFGMEQWPWQMALPTYFMLLGVFSVGVAHLTYRLVENRFYQKGRKRALP